MCESGEGRARGGGETGGISRSEIYISHPVHPTRQSDRRARREGHSFPRATVMNRPRSDDTGETGRMMTARSDVADGCSEDDIPPRATDYRQLVRATEHNGATGRWERNGPLTQTMWTERLTSHDVINIIQRPLHSDPLLYFIMNTK